MSERETAVVIGVGPGLGRALVELFAAEGMRVLAAARNPDKLGGALKLDNVETVACDATDQAAVTALFEKAGGAADLTVFNAGAFVPGGVLETEPEEFMRCWKVGCFAGFLAGQAAARGLIGRLEKGGPGGSILFTGATASLRGSARFHNLAVGKFGLRALAQSMARELGPAGIHVAHIIIDGQIRSERDGYRESERGADTVLHPDAIAQNYLQLHRQPRSAWTHELDLRPFSEKF
ncbi:MAG: SDR family NAD(P)-dependent oxidoreductase [Gammaproteobacteria bacterium]|nr:SDR family NAD(P)-dependent oxidoreductase [Gammaproteobacteria bacterium]